MKQKSFFITIGLVVVVAVIFLVWINNHYKTKVPMKQSVVQNTAPTPTPTPRFQVKSLDLTTLPPNIPTDLPMEKGAKVIESQSIVDTKTSTHQSNYVYVTAKSIA